MSAEDANTLSKSARKRANRKAREGEEAGAEAEAPAPAPKASAKEKAAPKAKAEPKAEPKAEAKAKAKSKAKEAAAPAPAAPKAEAKAKAKGKAAPKAEAAPAPAPEPKKAAAKGKAAAKAKSKPKEEEEEVQESKGPLTYTELDDGTNKDMWEVSTGKSKKEEKRQANLLERKQLEQASKQGTVIAARGNQHIPGLAPVEVQLAQAKGKAQAKAGASQAVGAVAVVSKITGVAQGLEPAAPVKSDNSVAVTVQVPEAKIGRVVGPKGANIILIKEKTGVKTIDMSGEVCTIVGSQDACTLAEHAVRQLVEKGYMSISFEDFEEEGVPMLPSLFPDIIGKGGVMIQEIKKQAKVEVNIPPVPKNAPAGKKYKVTLAGSKAGVQLGKEILSSIAMYGHHSLTHPGIEHKEMEIESWRYAFLIGSKGSEMRHIQNNYKVRVNIPREHSDCQNVLIIGEARDVERAVKYIEKVLYEENNEPKGRGAQDKAEDTWGEEGAVEDWMRPYMYQRK